MPVYRVSITNLLIKAKDEEGAKFGACNYVAGDLGIECIDAKLESTDEQLAADIKEGYEESDLYDYVHS